MKVLFIGDSITRGTQSVDWIKMIEKDHPYWTMDNVAANGETLTKLSERLKTHLQQNSDYHAVVLQTITNDILLPTFKHRGFWFRQAYRYQIKSGNVPAAPPVFEALLRQTVDYVQKHYNIQLILTTLGCINENLLAETNAKLFSYNSIVKKVAKEMNCILADVSEDFQYHLNKGQTQDYCADDFANTAFLDLISCNIGMADKLSQKRKLHLTIDGVHLNSKGAQIFKEKIETAVLLTKEKSLLFI
ncbi:SGNH/GDSL hydrolase family protein [Paradesertivirga mongoliensis]|uniref:SGNH/GDSL hydrolase family protein n=1 Tax=Paradesertivirga mongoliensis TaxID=2100740 RepID=A0ABW4ZKP2_9SPHI|nr:GDSL-type esterase/lipase family protein [Pedobacter mongoliensis]